MSRKVRQAIWSVAGMFSVIYLAGAIIDYYKNYTPAGLVGRCYTLENPLTHQRDMTVKIVQNGDEYARVTMLEYGQTVSLANIELRDRRLEEVKCEKNN